MRCFRGLAAKAPHLWFIPSRFRAMFPARCLLVWKPLQASKSAGKRSSEGYLCDARLGSRQAVEQSAGGAVSSVLSDYPVHSSCRKACLIRGSICLIL